MRICVISEHASPLATVGGVDAGGQNVYVAQVAQRLAMLGHSVDVLTRADSTERAPISSWVPGVRVVHVPAGPPRPISKDELLPHMPEFTEWMRQWCRRERYDVVHANFWMSALVAAELKRDLRLPFAVTFHALGRVRRIHQGADDPSPPERMAIEDRVVAEADRIIAECPQDEEDLIRLYDADPAKIVTIPCGFDPAEFHPISRALARNRIGASPRDWLILQLGRMVRRKGVDTAISATARLVHQHGVPARLLVVGGSSEDPDPELTPELGRLMEVAHREEIEDRVRLVGRRSREELKYYYSAADVFVTTPWYEPFGITPLEAMACGVPVVGSNVGGIKFTVRDGETGYLVPPKDPDALAERLAELHANPKLAARLGRKGLRRVRDLFTWKDVASSISEVLEQIIADPAREREAARLSAVEGCFTDLARLLFESGRSLKGAITEAAGDICSALLQGNRVLVAGNGGSASQAQHLAAELVGRFRLPDRRGLPVVSLASDVAVLTAWSNDVGFEEVFARQVEAHGTPGDVLVGMSTSGRSENLVRAFRRAGELGIRRIALLGGDGGPLRDLADVCLIVPSADTPRVQEVHVLVLHLLAELVEEEFTLREGRRLVAVGDTGARRPPRAAGPALTIEDEEETGS